MGTVVTYSRKAHGEQSLSENFRVREFACKDGSDKILVDTDLVALLQKIRDHFGAAVSINSAYRTPAHNKAVGGATGSQHVKGTAADIVVAGAAPLEVAQYAEYLMPESGGIGVYQSFTMWMYAPNAPAGTTAAAGRWLSAAGRATFRQPRRQTGDTTPWTSARTGPGRRSRSSSTRAVWASMARAWT